LKRLIFIIATISIAPSYLFAQEIKLYLHPYYGSYRMKELQEIQQVQLSESVIPLRETEEIRGYWGYEAGVQADLGSKSFLSVYGGLNSTGGRLHYSDYSGEAYVNNKLRGTHLGLQYSLFALSDTLQENLSFGFRAGVSFTSFNSQSVLAINGLQSQQENSEFRGTGFHIGPSIQYNFNVFQKIDLGLNIRYEYFFPGKLSPKNNSDAYLVTPKGEKAGADWSGLRIGLVIQLNP